MTIGLTDFRDSLVGAVIDPLKRCEIYTTTTAQILERKLGSSTGIPGDVAQDIARGPKNELRALLCAMLENGDFSGAGRAFAAFETALSNAIQFERQHGRLVPVCAETELLRCKNVLADHRWDGGAEHDALLQMIKPGEKIQSIEFWKIILDTGREIGRGEVRAFLKPPTWSNRSGSWESQFVSDGAVREAEESAARQAANANTAGLSARNWDLPDGVRQI